VLRVEKVSEKGESYPSHCISKRKRCLFRVNQEVSVKKKNPVGGGMRREFRSVTGDLFPEVTSYQARGGGGR